MSDFSEKYIHPCFTEAEKTITRKLKFVGEFSPCYWYFCESELDADLVVLYKVDDPPYRNKTSGLWTVDAYNCYSEIFEKSVLRLRLMSDETLCVSEKSELFDYTLFDLKKEIPFPHVIDYSTGLKKSSKLEYMTPIKNLIDYLEPVK